MSSCRSMNMQPGSTGLDNKVSQIRDQTWWGLCSRSFCSTGEDTRYFSRKAFGLRSWLRHRARCSRMDCMVCLGCCRVMRRKGDSVPATTVREIIKAYVKDNNLQKVDNGREVILDPVLSDCVLRKGENRATMTWQEIVEGVTHNMPHAFQITFEGKEPSVKKGKLEPIKITVDTRTANKKVTLIQNLETYGIDPEKIAHHVQIAVAASTSIVANPGGKGTMVLIQGNQVLYLQKVFLDILKVPRKYIQGLENVPKKK